MTQATHSNYAYCERCKTLVPWHLLLGEAVFDQHFEGGATCLGSGDNVPSWTKPLCVCGMNAGVTYTGGQQCCLACRGVVIHE